MDLVRHALITAGALALAFAAQAQDDASTLRVHSLAASCAGCHGTDGHAVASSAVPALAGAPAAQTVEKLQAFKRGERPSTVMQQIARGYTDAQIEQLAAWFAVQRP